MIHHSKDVDKDAPSPRDMKRTPDKLGSGCIDHGMLTLGPTDSTRTASPEQKSGRNQVMAVVRVTAYAGIAERAVTLVHTRHPGMPRSRAKDQNCRDVEASIPAEEQLPIATIMAPAVAVPATDPVAWWNIVRKGTRASRTPVISSTQKSNAISMLKPRTPLISTVSINAKGTATVALVISSDSWTVSALGSVDV
ncbi:hypothetical protein APSETT445_006173 [Aspergillus pseudonomiae]